MPKLKGLATGIGSLPHLDPEAAVELVLRYLPQIPFWPQLPKLGGQEGMTAQFMQNLPQSEESLEVFYEKIINKDLGYFQISKDSAAGLYAFKDKLQSSPQLLKTIEFIKCQITGPFTVAASLKNREGVALLHDSVLMQAFIKGLAMKALWQIKFFKEFNKKIILFIDEPYLGCFGSAFTPLNRGDVVKGLGELSETIKSEEVLIGVHCCGNTDWSIFTDTPGIDIINFDAFSFLEKFVLYSENLRAFLERGGVVCWGIVPTQEFSGKETVDFLVKKLEDGLSILEKKGLGRDLLEEGLLISPSCGLGALDTQKATQIFHLLSQTSAFLRKKF
ncbi:MAG: methionine synthase [Candidatus Omnitrophica bacterium]|nr:methionine synthase [Candidatus Omnitrophota bacterium]MDD5653856.1 methionine synthase [Candidatus Omnitrophota bacterium]